MGELNSKSKEEEEEYSNLLQNKGFIIVILEFFASKQARLLCVLSADYQLKVVTVELLGVMCHS